MAAAAEPPRCYVALGSNLGDRARHLGEAVAQLRALEGVRLLRTSSLYTTAPQYVAEQPSFLNAVAELELSQERLAALSGLLVDLKRIEESLGREPGTRRGPRVIDLDILAVGDLQLKTTEPPFPMQIPHACLHERDFVLVPMVELCPEWQHPGREGRPTVRQMLQALGSAIADLPAGASKETPPVQVFPGAAVPSASAGRTLWPRGAKTLIQGILNATPDSFSDGGDCATPGVGLARAEAMVAAGADVIDVGGESTRPGSAEVGVEEEIGRVVPIIRAIREKQLNVAVSVDTRKARVASAAVEAGADWINDVSGGEFDSEMLTTAAKLGVPIILMHMRGTPATMQSMASYKDVVAEVGDYLLQRRDAALQAGVAAWNILLDPGIGFAKTTEHNLAILRRCRDLTERLRPSPVVIGASRKRFVGEILEEPVAKKRTFGNAATTAAAVVGLADVVRVHDVLEMSQTAKVCDRIYRQPGPGS